MSTIESRLAELGLTLPEAAAPDASEDKTDEIAATYESLGMNVDLETRRSAPYPDWAIARMERLKAAQAGIELPPQQGQSLGIRRK